MHDDQMRIEDNRFSKEDLFALLGGFDAEMFACPGDMTGNTDPRRKKKLEQWRSTLVRRYVKLGLVDDAGNPREDLAHALEPLRQPVVTVSDESEPALWDGETEKRTVCIYLRGDLTGTAVIRGKGLRGGYFLLPLATPLDAYEAMLAIHRIRESFVSAPPAEHVVIGGDSDLTWAAALMHNRPSEVIGTADRCGFDPLRLLTVGDWWRDKGSRLQASRRGLQAVSTLSHVESAIGGAMFDRMVRNTKAALPVVCGYVVSNYSGIEFSGPEEDGIAYRLPNFERDGSFRSKTTIALPAIGFSYAFERAPRPNDPAQWNTADLIPYCRFGSFDFHETAVGFAERLLIIDENPNA